MRKIAVPVSDPLPSGRAVRVFTAVVAAVAVLSSAGCETKTVEAPVVLGPEVATMRFGGVSKPVVESADPSAEFAATALQNSRVWFGVGVSNASSDDRSTLICEVRVRSDGKPSRVVETLEVVPAEDKWTESIVEFEDLAAGTFEMDCPLSDRSQLGVHWAKPIVLRRGEAPLVVLISLDTLRADYVEGFGGKNGTTPVLKKLGEEGVRFVSMTSEGTWTLPSHFSMLYSRFYGWPVQPKPLVPLAQALSEAGFATIGLTGGGFMSAEFRYHDGFSHYSEAYAATAKESDVEVFSRLLADAREWIERIGDVPTFLFLHTYAVHELTAAEKDWRSEPSRRLELFRPTAEQVDDVRTFYGALVRETDSAMKPFVDYLRRVNETRPVLLVVTSDHGEAFGEHDNFRHGSDGPQSRLYDELIRIPLVVWGPGRIPAGRRSLHPHMLMDIAPTLMSAQGLEIPGSMSGTDLWSVWSGRAASVDSPRRDCSVSFSNGAWALSGREMKLISRTGPDGEEVRELFDLVRDPHEANDLASREPDRVEDLVQELRACIADAGVSADGTTLPACPACNFVDALVFWNGVFERGEAAESFSSDEEAAEHLDGNTRERLKVLGYIE